MKVKFTHKAWIGIAPVYVSNIDTTPNIIERHWLFGWLVTANIAVFRFFTGGFPMLVTAKLPVPLELEGDIE